MMIDAILARQLVRALDASLASSSAALDARPAGDGSLAWAAELHNAALRARDVLREALPPADLWSGDTYDQFVALVEEGIREGRIHPEGSAEEHDALAAERALSEGRLLAAARSVSALVRPAAWDELREIAWDAGAPSDVFSWDRAGVIRRDGPLILTGGGTVVRSW